MHALRVQLGSLAEKLNARISRTSTYMGRGVSRLCDQCCYSGDAIPAAKPQLSGGPLRPMFHHIIRTVSDYSYGKSTTRFECRLSSSEGIPQNETPAYEQRFSCQIRPPEWERSRGTNTFNTSAWDSLTEGCNGTKRVMFALRTRRGI